MAHNSTITARLAMKFARSIDNTKISLYTKFKQSISHTARVMRITIILQFISIAEELSGA